MFCYFQEWFLVKWRKPYSFGSWPKSSQWKYSCLTKHWQYTARSPAFHSLCQAVFAWRHLQAAGLVESCVFSPKLVFTILLSDQSEISRSLSSSSWFFVHFLTHSSWCKLDGFVLQWDFVRLCVMLKSFPYIKTVFFFPERIQQFYKVTNVPAFYNVINSARFVSATLFN